MPHTTLCHAYVSARDDDGGFLGALSFFVRDSETEVQDEMKMMMNMLMMTTTTMIMMMILMMVFSTVDPYFDFDYPSMKISEFVATELLVCPHNLQV